MPHHRGLDGAAMQSVSPFLVREPRPGGARTVEVAGLDDQQAVLLPQPARRDVDRRQVAAMAVGDDEAPYAGGADRGAHLDHGFDEQLGRQAERAREPAMFPAGAHRLRGQRPGRKVRGKPAERLGQHAEAEHEVGRERQMGPVLLDRGHRQHDHRIAWGERRRLDRGQALPVADWIV